MEGSDHGVAPPFGSTAAVYSREALAAPWHAPHTISLCMCTGLPLQLEQDAKSVIVCLWLDSKCCLLANADTQCLNEGSVESALAWSSPPISCFRSDEIRNSLSGVIGVRWDEKSHQAQLGNLHFRIHIRIINQQLFRLLQRQFVHTPSHKNIHISHCLQGSPKNYKNRRKPFTMDSLWLMYY